MGFPCLKIKRSSGVSAGFSLTMMFSTSISSIPAIALARRFKGGRRDIIASGNRGSISGADISKKVSGRPPVNDMRTGLAPSVVSSDVKFS